MNRIMRLDLALACMACLLCLWAAPVAQGSEPRPVPADLVDMARIRSLTLEDLEWREERRELAHGAVVIGGSWKGPRFVGYAAGFEEAELDLTETATIYLPAALPAGATVHEVVWAVHDASTAAAGVPGCAALASEMPVAFLLHGQKSADWRSLGFSSRDEMTAMTFLVMQLLNACQPADYRTGNFGLALAETQMMALTLLERVLEAEGFTPGRAALKGLSKEGFSTWFAAAVDDRLTAAAPGGFPLQDWVSAISNEEAAWGCEGTGAAGAAMRDLVRLRKWFTLTAAGATGLAYFSASEFTDQLWPEFLLLHGDAGLATTHDGVYFTPGDDTPFLETFTARPFRFDRMPDDGVREDYETWFTRLAALLADYLVRQDSAAYPKIEQSSVDTQGGQFRARAHVSGQPEAVRLWWSHSENRPFNDAGNPPWTPVPMTADGPDWVSPWLPIPEGMAVGWYVEAENTLHLEARAILRRDTSPQRFFNTLPPLVCPGISDPDCTPPAAPAGLVAIATDSRVDLEWEDASEWDFDHYRVKRGSANEGPYATLASDLTASSYTDLDVTNDTTYYYIVTAVDVDRNESFPSREVHATPSASARPFRRGDANADGALDIADAVFTLNYLFAAGPVPPCADAADANDDGTLDISDAVTLLAHLFAGAGPLPAPFGSCGGDPSPDTLTCASFPPCDAPRRAPGLQAAAKIPK